MSKGSPNSMKINGGSIWPLKNKLYKNEYKKINENEKFNPETIHKP